MLPAPNQQAPSKYTETIQDPDKGQGSTFVRCINEAKGIGADKRTNETDGAVETLRACTRAGW